MHRALFAPPLNQICSTKSTSKFILSLSTIRDVNLTSNDKH